MDLLEAWRDWVLMRGVRGTFVLGMTLWVLGTWISQLGWRVCPPLEDAMRQYARLKDLLGRDPTYEELS